MNERYGKDEQMTICTSSSIRTMTVGPGIAPDLLTSRVLRPIVERTCASARGLAGWRALDRAMPPHTAGGEFHPALKTY